MKRNLFSLLGAVAMMASLVGCGGESSTVAEEGKVINIWCWNNEFQSRFNTYYPEVQSVEGNTTTLKNGKKVNFIIHANDNNGYQIPLDAALAKQDKAAADEKIDIFLMEADYAIKYVGTDYTLDVYKDIGLKAEDTANMYDYTKTVVTDSKGVLKGVSWQATPGLYAFRSDYAAKIWSDYPADPTDSDSASEKAKKTAAQAAFVQTKLSDWSKFDSVAAAAKAKDIKMVSGYDDMYRVFSNNAKNSWVDSNGKVTIDPAIKDWIKKEKTYATEGYSGSSTLWSDPWAKDQGPEGSVLGFFYSTWGINFTLSGNSLATPVDETGKTAAEIAAAKKNNGLYGKYRVCEGPASYYWGGTWIAAAKGTDNVSDVKDIMLKLTCDKAIAKKITTDTQDYTNHKSAMNEIANDANYGSDFLGGQNHIKLFASSAANIKLAGMSAYDQGCNEQLQNAMRDYFAGSKDYATCYANFEQQVRTLYPEVKFNDSNKTL